MNQLNKLEKLPGAIGSAIEKLSSDVAKYPRKYGLIILALVILGSAINGLVLNDFRIAVGLIVAAILPISWYVIQIDENVVHIKDNKIIDNKADQIVSELSTLKECNDILTTYTKITEPGFCAYKNKLMETFLKEITSLAEKKRTGHLSVELGHSWSIPRIEKLQDDDYIRALSFLNNDKGEWENISSPRWAEYNDAMKSAAEKCKDVIRIFIADDETFRKHFSDEKSIVHKHSLKRDELDKVRCICVDKKKLDTYYREKRHHFDNSFIIISSNDKKMAVFDIFLDRSEVEKRYCVEISYGPEVQEIDTALKNLIKSYYDNKSLILSDYVYNEMATFAP
ncbi:hypothetical protein [Methanomethylovorans sp.]|uniref:hypothetical protein n=1 Tax=Methanomethylovorans sp. TaxID=2758717 RepID=UPI00351BF450